jgi:hypothetical protein
MILNHDPFDFSGTVRSNSRRFVKNNYSEGNMRMRMPLGSRILFLVISVLLVAGAFIADYSNSHIFNPLWPPHAKFHVGQTLTFSLLLAVLTIFFAFRKTSDRYGAVAATASFSAIYYIAQASAIFYPGTAFCDPEFVSRPGQFVLGIPVQLLVDLTSLTLTVIASWLALRKDALWKSIARGPISYGSSPLKPPEKIAM